MFTKRFTLTILIAMTLLVFCGAVFAQSMQVYQEVFDTDNTSYPDNDAEGAGLITFQAWIAGTFLSGGTEYDRTRYILTETSPGSQTGMMFGRFYILVNAGNFNTAPRPDGWPAPPTWQQGETLHIQIFREASEHIATTSFQLSAPPSMFRDQISVPGQNNSVYLRTPPVAIFDSNRQDDDGNFIDRVQTTATPVQGSNPDANGVYRASHWAIGNSYHISFSPDGFEEITFSSQVRRQFVFDEDLFDDVRGPRFVRTQYSIDGGEEWISYANPDGTGEANWRWTLPENENWVNVSFELPEECYGQEEVLLRLLVFNLTGAMNNGFLSVKDVVVAGNLIELPVYDLRIDVIGQGSTVPQADSTYFFEEGSRVPLMATADEDWNFSHWLIIGADTTRVNADSTMVVMTRNFTAIAHFIEGASPNPTAATHPSPANNATGVSLELENLRWRYTSNEAFTDPVGFRVYFGDADEFDEDFIWVDYDEDEVNFSIEVPTELGYATRYFWQVIPTTIDPDDDGRNGNRTTRTGRQRDESNYRGDAVNCPVWSFVTVLIPNPVAARNPYPVNDSVGVSVNLDRVRWDYVANPQHVTPLGFRVYGGTSREFDEDEFAWVPYVQNQVGYFLIHQVDVQYATTYYWQVIPTTINPDDDGRGSNRNRRTTERTGINNTLRGDAENCPVWSFKTELMPNPAIARNPYPVDDSVGVAVDIERIRWDYVVDTLRVNPLGFRVYGGTNPDFDEDEFAWIPYVANQVGYSIPIEDDLEYATTYYWQVIPTTIDPDDDGRGSGRNRRTTERTSINNTFRGDAADCPVWSFRTELIPNPTIAVNPIPVNDTVNVAVDLAELSWSFIVDTTYVNPVGFRVYFNDTGEFGVDDDFEWVAYDEDEVNFSSSDILPEELDYFTTYYWKVVPTTIDPDDDGRRSNDHRERRRSLLSGNRLSRMINRGDAENVPVWSFRTQQYPNPVAAVIPRPVNDTINVSVNLEELSWSFIPDTTHVNPLGFRVYFNDTGEFGVDDDFEWVAYDEEEENFSASELLPEELNFFTRYYWKVVPTTIAPDDGRFGGRNRRNSQLTTRHSQLTLRGDAEDVQVWSFRTEQHQNPKYAVNPSPADDTLNVSIQLEALGWSFIVDTTYVNPVGFRVYFGTNPDELSQHGAFVHYEEGEEHYSLSRIHAPHLSYSTTYYWKVVPTTIDPDGQRRGDAENVPVWSFTTAEDPTSVEVPNPEAVTSLHGNYPNPFNPQTVINFSLAQKGEVSIEIYNTRGQKIRSLLNDTYDAGRHQAVWNGKDDHNTEVSSGIYFYRMKTSDYQSVMKMMMLK